MSEAKEDTRGSKGALKGCAGEAAFRFKNGQTLDEVLANSCYHVVIELGIQEIGEFRTSSKQI